LACYRARAPPEEVANVWFDGLEPEAREVAKADAPTARACLRRAIVDSEYPEVRADAADGWRYTGAVLRAADSVLGIPPPVPCGGRGAAAASGSGAPPISRLVLPGDGQPGSLSLWWSDFEAADNVAQLRERGVTHRLNCAAEAVGKFREESIPTAHVPMQDSFDIDTSEDAISIWKEQFEEVLRILREWREVGAVVNVSCQMGKNRSGCIVLLWLCAERGWKVEEGVEKLRGITALACANPHLVKAVGEFLHVEAAVPLNPAGDGGGWVCISPPGSPRAGGTRAFEDVALRALARLEGGGIGISAVDQNPEEEQKDEEAGDMAGLFDGL